MNEETWKLECDDNSDTNISGSSGISSNKQNKNAEQTIIDSEPQELERMCEYFGNKPFLRFQAQGFEQCVLSKAYKAEEDEFIKTVEIVPKDKVPQNANIIKSHAIYKIKTNDDSSMKLKARIAPHGNEDSMRDELTTDCATCSPAGLRILESIASLFGWTIVRVDGKAAFLQTGKAQRKVYVIPPAESRMKATHCWLLLFAAYGLVNANAKSQVQSDEVMYKIGLLQCKHCLLYTSPSPRDLSTSRMPSSA